MSPPMSLALLGGPRHAVRFLLAPIGFALGCQSQPEQPAPVDREAVTPALTLALPIAIADLRHERYGIWPFGIHGGGHPEGHGGFDFELDANAAVRAPLAGRIARRADSEMFAGQQDLAIEGDGFQVQIGHLHDVPEACRPGSRVERGQFLGHPSSVNDGEFHMIHFAVHRDGSSEPYGEECPLAFFAADDVRALEAFYATVPAAHKDAFESALCNPRRLRDPDPLVGVWFPCVASGALPHVLTLTPFAETPQAHRALVMGRSRMSDVGTWRASAPGVAQVSVTGWPDLEVRLEGDVLLVTAKEASARYQRDAFASLRF